MITMLSLSTPWTSSLCGDGQVRAAGEGLFAAPDRPDDARQLVRDRDRRFVVAASSGDRDRPVLKPRPLPFSQQRPLSRE
jgi:hypothetical protein